MSHLRDKTIDKNILFFFSVSVKVYLNLSVSTRVPPQNQITQFGFHPSVLGVPETTGAM